MICGIKDKRDLYFCHEHNEKKRCPKCGSLETKKKGFTKGTVLTDRGKISHKLQRFICKVCNSSFTSKGYNSRTRVSNHIKRKAVADFVLTKNSLSEVAIRYSVSRQAILNWMKPIAAEIPDQRFPDVSFSGVIQIDAKETKVKGNRRTIFLAVDAVNRIPVIYGKYDYENTANSADFLEKLKNVYPVKGIISDFGREKCFAGVIRTLFPKVPHQICPVHFLRYLWMQMPRTRKSKYFWRNNVLRWIVKKIVKSDNREAADYWLNKFKKLIPFFRASYHKQFIKSVQKNYQLLTSRLEHKFLHVTTNIVENVNRTLERKLKNLDGFKSDDNLDAFLKIWFFNYKLSSVRPN